MSVEAITTETVTLDAASTGEKPDFAALGVRQETVDALAEHGITHPFAIQELTLPLALGGADLIGQARTGTGKTLAFGIPLLQRVASEAEGADGRPQALVVVPTRELCVQVTEDLRRAGLKRNVRLLSVYGGRAYEPQVNALKAGIDIVVGTPGRLLDLARQRLLDLSGVGALVLDEADEMLDLGFLPDVERIIEQLPASRQTMLFSATMPGPVVSLARRFLDHPVHVTAEQPDEGRTVPETSQHVFRAHAMDKSEVLARILQASGRGLVMVFTRTKRTADKVAEDLVRRGFAAAAVHGDLGQGQREQALRAFRAGKIDVLVATDVAARGIDVSGVTHVVNYQCPEDEKVYLHRIGRTGRAGESGVAVTFVDWDDVPRWMLVNKALKLPFVDPPETYSTSPHLYEALDIPLGVTGMLPRASRTRAGLGAEQVEDIGETGSRARKRTTPDRGSDRNGRGEPGRRRESSERRPARDGQGSTPDADGAATDTGSTPGPGAPRPRRRTRGSGAAVAAVAGDGSDETAASQAAAAQTKTTQAPAVPAQGTAPTGPESADGSADPDGTARRRRRRGGRGRGRSTQGADQDIVSSDGTDADADAQAASA